jgi:Mg/Co/Ni transporter MgtE
MPQGMSSDMSREQLQRMRQESKQAKGEVSSKARNRIEVLLGLKRKTKEVEVEGVKFTLKSLKHSEYQEIFNSLSKMSDANNFVVSLELQIQSLSRSITHIDSIPVESVLNAESVDDVIEYFREFDNELIEQLYNEFKSLKEAGEVKPEEEKEVNEDLKK